MVSGQLLQGETCTKEIWLVTCWRGLPRTDSRDHFGVKVFEREKPKLRDELYGRRRSGGQLSWDRRDLRHSFCKKDKIRKTEVKEQHRADCVFLMGPEKISHG